MRLELIINGFLDELTNPYIMWGTQNFEVVYDILKNE